MYKKLFISVLLFLFSISFVSSISAQEDTVSPTMMTQTKQQSNQKQEEEYTLPYPGILPDSPFYFLKTARDNLIGFLISDTKKKIEFDLLQADKRLQAGVYVIEKSKKYDLAEQTISKGENYFEQAIAKLGEAKKQGTDITELEGTLKKAAHKHTSVLKDIEKKAPNDKKKLFSALQNRVRKFEFSLK